jgi:4-carboxymuconolactone decarboxylase
LTPAIEAMPDKEGRIVAGRLKEWQQNMDATVSGIKGIAERMLPRLPDARRDDLDDRGRELWDAITGSRGASVTSATGALVGPFNVWLYAPEAGIRLSDLGAVLRFGTSLDRRLLELAIITVGAHWQAEFEWYAHARMAREHGVDEAVIDRIGRGEDPQLGRDDEAAVYAVARQLLTTAKLDEATYIAGEALIGRRGMVELVSLCGYYTMVSFTLNAFRVPLPPGANPQWTG